MSTCQVFSDLNGLKEPIKYQSRLNYWYIAYLIFLLSSLNSDFRGCELIYCRNIDELQFIRNIIFSTWINYTVESSEWLLFSLFKSKVGSRREVC